MRKIVFCALALASLTGCSLSGPYDGKWASDKQLTIQKSEEAMGREVRGSNLRNLNQAISAFDEIEIDDGKLEFAVNGSLITCEISESNIMKCLNTKTDDTLNFDVKIEEDVDSKILVVVVKAPMAVYLRER